MQTITGILASTSGLNWKLFSNSEDMIMNCLNYFTLNDEASFITVNKQSHVLVMKKWNLCNVISWKVILNSVNMSMILSKMKNLKTVYFSDCPWLNEITESGCKLIHLLAKYCINLEYLEVANIQSIHDSDCQHLITNCTKLKYIDLTYCQHITYKAVFILRNFLDLTIETPSNVIVRRQPQAFE